MSDNGTADNTTNLEPADENARKSEQALFAKNRFDSDGNPPAILTHEDGTNFNFLMYYDNRTEMVFADTYQELLGALIPGYVISGEVERARLILDYSIHATARIQTDVVTADIYKGSDGTWSHFGERTTADGTGVEEVVTPVSVEEYAILTQKRGLPQIPVLWWTSELPYVVLETSYEPYTAIPRPASALYDGVEENNPIWWINNATDEESLLHSLAATGWVEIFNSAPVEAEDL